MNYGYFDNRHKEYVITTPKTPVKWINYLGTLAFGGFVDHTGGALLCKGDPALNRITKYIPQLPDADFKGTTLYLRIKEEKGEKGYRIFSPFCVPTLTSCELYECRVGLGYTRIVSECYGIRTDVTIFIPRDGSQELRDIRVTNFRETPVTVDAIPVVEYSHPDALKQFTNADWVPQTMQSRALPEADGCICLLQAPFMHLEHQVNLCTSNHPAASFETDRSCFLGCCGSWAAPQSLQTDELGNHEALRGDNIAALLHHLGALQPGESRQLITQLTQAESVEVARTEIARYRDPAEVTAAFKDLAQFWVSYLATLQVETPDAATNTMLTIHTPRQVYTTLNWSRYLSLYQLGFGARGVGFRDSAQDILGVVAHAPEESRALLEKLLQVQRRDGSALHQFNPLTMVANEGDSREVEEGPRYYGDDHLWIVLAVTAYLKETGDLSFLEKALPYYDKDQNEQPIASGSVRDHLKRALAFTEAHLGAHGLPLLGFADWNDTVNLRAGAESLFIANLYGKALLEMAALESHLGDAVAAAACLDSYETMRARVNAVAWDGAWYVRYFDADGSPLGSQHNTHGKLYANAQSWPVISGFAPPERAQRALQAVHAHLNTRNGIKLSAPGYNGFDPTKGGVTTYPPGAKENGGIFLHANPWVIIAETHLGHGDRAFAYYQQINPAAKNDRLDEFECEPYVYPQNILGDEHPQFGLARNSWLTGTASWAYQAGVQYILGIRATYTGLEIDPCIPAAWEGFHARRTFRGATYEIEVRNPDHICKGVKAIFVDGNLNDGPSVPCGKREDIHKIQVIMG